MVALNSRVCRVGGQHPHLADGGGDLEVVRHLQGEFTGRAHHQRLRLALGLMVGVPGICLGDDALQQADPEGQGLAGAGTGLADHVGAGDGDRNRQGLDREGILDTDRVERLDRFGDDAQVGERDLRGCFLQLFGDGQGGCDLQILQSDVAQCGGLTCAGRKAGLMNSHRGS
jgi:hypothetical protein